MTPRSAGTRRRPPRDPRGGRLPLPRNPSPPSPLPPAAAIFPAGVSPPPIFVSSSSRTTPGRSPVGYTSPSRTSIVSRARATSSRRDDFETCAAARASPSATTPREITRRGRSDDDTRKCWTCWRNVFRGSRPRRRRRPARSWSRGEKPGEETTTPPRMGEEDGRRRYVAGAVATRLRGWRNRRRATGTRERDDRARTIERARSR